MLHTEWVVTRCSMKVRLNELGENYYQIVVERRYSYGYDIHVISDSCGFSLVIVIVKPRKKWNNWRSVSVPIGEIKM